MDTMVPLEPVEGKASTLENNPEQTRPEMVQSKTFSTDRATIENTSETKCNSDDSTRASGSLLQVSL